MAEKPLLIKFLIVGDCAVGKSSLLVRFSDGNFTESYISTIGIDFKLREADIEGRRCKIQLWDTAGQERFRTITSAYYRGAHGIVLVYDVTNRNSFENVSYWMKHIEKYSSENVNCILVGNKIDESSKREVSRSEGLQLAGTFNVEFYECSAKNGMMVEQCFMDLALAVKKSISHEHDVGTTILLEGKRDSKQCCNR
eukprot:TRINITY_DN1815_c0_g1_i1.p1 TRINITY_DN1815_c0_g1~~TRINITY_DN1815_c0_g1_i1.p1  ORF type:complete len:197 (-),score=31.19 TRINITY_DN1815_c0_g1_i1:22-612(-)